MIRSLLFNLFFFTGVAITCIVSIPALFLPSKITSILGKFLGYWAIINLKIFLNCTIKIKGKENLVKNEKYFVACAHQSMFETFFLQTIIGSPIFILKKELFKIPVFGLFLKKMGSVAIIRSTTTKDNLGFLENIKEKVNKYNRTLIIFPQGTRTPPNETPPFKKGVGRIYETLKIKCLPIALASGNVWPKKGFNKKVGNITVSILKPIDSGMEKENFIKILEKKIYDEMDSINESVF